MRARDPERMIDVDWGEVPARGDAVYLVDVQVVAHDRQGLLRDISEVFSREKINVVGVQTESRKGIARMGFTAEVGDARQLQKALVAIAARYRASWRPGDDERACNAASRGSSSSRIRDRRPLPVLALVAAMWSARAMPPVPRPRRRRTDAVPSAQSIERGRYVVLLPTATTATRRATARRRATCPKRSG